MERFDLVQKAYNELVASGVVREYPTPQDDSIMEAMKFAVTARAAYYINQIMPSRGLLAKTTGTNVKGYKADVIMDQNGTTFDISTDNSKKIIIQDSGGTFEPDLRTLWRQPTKELAGLNGEPDGPQPPLEDKSHELIMKALTEISDNQRLIMDGQTMMMQAFAELITLIQSLKSGLEIKFPEYETNKLPIFGVVTLKPKEDKPKREKNAQ